MGHYCVESSVFENSLYCILYYTLSNFCFFLFTHVGLGSGDNDNIGKFTKVSRFMILLLCNVQISNTPLMPRPLLPRLLNNLSLAHHPSSRSRLYRTWRTLSVLRQTVPATSLCLSYVIRYIAIELYSIRTTIGINISIVGSYRLCGIDCI